MERSFIGSLGLEGPLCGGLKKWTKKLFTTIWCRGNPQAVSFQQHLGHTICPQFYPSKVRKTVLCVVKGCLNNFCPIKYFLVRVFFCLFCFVGLGFLFPAISFSPLLNPVPRFSSPVSSKTQVPHSENSRIPKANTTLRVVSHSQEDTGSLPWIAIPLLQNYYSLRLSCCSPSFGGYLRPDQASPRLVELGATAE